MTYRMLDNGSVFDGPRYLGAVYTGLHGGFNVRRWRDERVIATLATKADAVEWLVCEHRDIPWADRPEAQRIAPDILHLTD